MHTADCPSLRLTEPSIMKALCPNDIVEYTCILNSVLYNANVSITLNGSAFNCPLKNNAITLIQAPRGPLNTSVVECGNLSAKMTNFNGTCYTSVLKISNPIYYIGNTIQCYDGNTMHLIGNDVLKQEIKGRSIT